MPRFPRILVALSVVGFAAPAFAADDAAGFAFFETKIRPALVQHCYKCHANKMTKGGLRLDSKAAILEGGNAGPIIVPGKPNDSWLLKVISHTDVALKMPPKDKVPAAVIADVTKWIEMGAPIPADKPSDKPPGYVDIEAGKKFWSFQPLLKAAPPAVKNAAWAKTPVDRFVLAKLEEKGLKPNAPAEREKLVRRLYFDMIGLPPTPAEIDAFVNDASPEAWEKLIDRLLTSERYGERWARHWLDVVRYAESGGYEFDGDRGGAHHYRDFVIKALNRDLPFDQFVRWQLAGDKLQPNDFEAASAAGFLVAGPYPGQTTAKTLEPIRYDHLDDMVSTVGTTFLGLTLGCARCHEHKYDPIPQMDYYRLIACLSKADSVTANLDPNPEIYKKAKAEWDAEKAKRDTAWATFVKDRFPTTFDAWWTKNKAAAIASPWLAADAVTATNKAGGLAKLPDGSALASSPAVKSDVVTFTIHTKLKGITSIRLDALADKSLPKSGPGRGANGEFALRKIEVTAAPLTGKDKPVTAKLKPIAATSEAKDKTLAAAVDDKKATGWSPAGAGKDESAVFALEAPISFDGGTVLTVTLKFDNADAIGRPRVSFATVATPKLDAAVSSQAGREIAAILGTASKPTEAMRTELVRWAKVIEPESVKAYAPVVEHSAKEPKPKLVPVFTTGQRGGDVFFLIRGEPSRKNGKPDPGFIQVLMSNAEKDAKWATAAKGQPPLEPRVALGNWMTDTESGAGQLLARVIVNRLWQHHFGRGLVATPNDFGFQGERPTHPELLDFLANELIRNGWKLKPLHKLLVASAVYTESGDENAANLTADPDNKLLWRCPPRRLEAEAVRDSLLAAGGTLDAAMYGPGTLDEASPRRSVYLTVKRSRPVPLLQLFDSPEAIQSIGARQVTTVPTQALTLMNSPFVRAQSEKLAKRVKPAGVELPAAVEAAYRTAVGRKPTAEEQTRAAAFVGKQATTYGAGAAGTERAFADFCQALLCSNEFVYVD